MRWLRTEIWKGSGVSPLFFIALTVMAATVGLAHSCSEPNRVVYVLYAEQPALHVIDSYRTAEECDFYRIGMATRYPDIIFHCDREVHG